MCCFLRPTWVHIPCLVYSMSIGTLWFVQVTKLFTFGFKHLKSEVRWNRIPESRALPPGLLQTFPGDAGRQAEGSLAAGPPFFMCENEMNFKTNCPSGGEMLNHVIQWTWESYRTVAENTVRKAFVSSPSLSLSLQAGQEKKNKTPHYQTNCLFALICCRRYLQTCSLRYVYLAPDLTHSIKL